MLRWVAGRQELHYRGERDLGSVDLNNILNFVQTVILAWIAAHPGRYYGALGSGRMQHNGSDTDK